MQQNYPQRTGIDTILKQAFYYWNKTMVYQILFSLIYLSVSFLMLFYFSSKYGILQQYLALSGELKNGMEAYQKGVAEIAKNPNYATFSWIVIGTFVFLYPLNLGFFKIYRKLDLGETPQFEDLFAGYVGSNFFIYTSYYLFWTIIYTYTLPTVFLALIWVLVTLFSAPLMFFMDKRIIETLGINFTALRKFPIEILVCVFVAVIFKYLGILTLIGVFFTLPFWNAIIYALYQKIFKENP